MLFVKGFLCCMFGAFFVYMGALQMAGALMPRDYAYKVGEMHGRWLRVNVLGLPPIEEKDVK